MSEPDPGRYLDVPPFPVVRDAAGTVILRWIPCKWDGSRVAQAERVRRACPEPLTAAALAAAAEAVAADIGGGVSYENPWSTPGARLPLTERDLDHISSGMG